MEEGQHWLEGEGGVSGVDGPQETVLSAQFRDCGFSVDSTSWIVHLCMRAKTTCTTTNLVVLCVFQVIQLVRDPRGILASRMETFRDTYRLWRLWRATGRRPHNLDLGQIHTVCEDFLSSVSTGLAAPAWLRGRYFLLR